MSDNITHRLVIKTGTAISWQYTRAGVDRTKDLEDLKVMRFLDRLAQKYTCIGSTIIIDSTTDTIKIGNLELVYKWEQFSIDFVIGRCSL